MNVHDFRRKFELGKLGNKKKYGPYYIVDLPSVQFMMAYSRADDSPYLCGIRDENGLVISTSCEVEQSSKPGSRKRDEGGYALPSSVWKMNFAKLEDQCGRLVDWTILDHDSHEYHDHKGDYHLVRTSLFTVGNNYYLADLRPGVFDKTLSATEYVFGKVWDKLEGSWLGPHSVVQLPCPAFNISDARATLLPDHIRDKPNTILHRDYLFLEVGEPKDNISCDPRHSGKISAKGLNIETRTLASLTCRGLRLFCKADEIAGRKLDPNQWYDVCSNDSGERSVL